MTKRYTVVVAARFDERLLEIDDYLAERSEKTAARVTKEILAKVESLTTMPKRGRSVPEIDDDDIRELLAVSSTYRIIYRVDEDRALVEVRTVVHAAREFPVDDLADDAE